MKQNAQSCGPVAAAKEHVRRGSGVRGVHRGRCLPLWVAGLLAVSADSHAITYQYPT